EVGFVHVDGVSAVKGEVAFDGDEALKRAEFGVRLGVEGDNADSLEVVVVDNCAVGVDVFAEVDLEAGEAADLQAGLGAGDVEVAGAESVTNANVFHGL